MVACQIPTGNPDALRFASQPNIARCRTWFSAWTHLQNCAFICEDIWWRRSDMSISEASQAAESIVREWLVNSSLERFEVWSGATDIQLSRRFQVTYAKFHNVHKTEPTRHKYLFWRDELARVWTLCPSTVPLRSATPQFKEYVCVDGCWICIAIEEEENVESLIAYLDDVREEDWYDKMMDLTLWSKLSGNPVYKLSI
jgi:hypothetical protein